MTWSYLSPLPHTSCIPYEEACSLTTRQYSHMLLALKIEAHYIFSKNLFLFVYSAWPFNLFQFVNTFFGYTYVTFYQNLLKLNIIPPVCMIVNILNWFLFAIMNSTTQWHIDISVSDLLGVRLSITKSMTTTINLGVIYAYLFLGNVIKCRQIHILLFF